MKSGIGVRWRYQRSFDVDPSGSLLRHVTPAIRGWVTLSGHMVMSRTRFLIPEGIKSTLQRALHAFGYHVHRHPERYSQEWHLDRLLRTLKINCVIDVGAHVGEFYDVVRATGYAGRIVSFEPVPESFSALQQRASKDSRWRGFNCALGEQRGVVPINLPSSSGFASFLTPNNELMAQFPHAGWIGRQLDVSVQTLDDFLPKLLDGLDNPRLYLKMDTQGWDCRVLEGAHATLAHVLAFQSEISAIPIYEGMTDLAESIKFYQQLGFVVVDLFPVSYDMGDLRVIEYDCVMISPNPAPHKCGTNVDSRLTAELANESC